MSNLLPLIVPILLIGAIVAAGLFLLRAWDNRTTSAQAAYNVGQHEARKEMQLNILRAFFVITVGVILLAIFFTTRLFQPEVVEAPTLVPTAGITSTSEPQPVPSTPSAPVITEPTPSASATEAVLASPTAVPASPTPLLTPTPSETPSPLTAVVTSGVGVWLRAAPSTDGDQIEWLLQGTELILLEEAVQGESFSWQQVQAPSGSIGWVADEFITVNLP